MNFLRTLFLGALALFLLLHGFIVLGAVCVVATVLVTLYGY